MKQGSHEQMMQKSNKDSFKDFVTRYEKTQRKLSSGDQVRARITAVSMGKAGSSGKIGVTARQPFLGKLEWIEKEVKKIEKAE